MPRARVCQAGDNVLPLLSQALHLQFIHSLAPAVWDGEEMSVLQAAFEDAALKLHRKKNQSSSWQVRLLQ